MNPRNLTPDPELPESAKYPFDGFDLLIVSIGANYYFFCVGVHPRDSIQYVIQQSVKSNWAVTQPVGGPSVLPMAQAR